MRSLKSRVAEGVVHVKNVVTETTGKLGHSAAEAFQKSDHAFTEAARKAKGLAVEAVDNLKHAAGKVGGKPRSDGVATHKTNRSH